MDLIKIGTFISEMRKQKGLTQKELAEQLHLSNRTISKWECGNGLPDNSIMMELCATLGISVNELLSGEKLSNDNYISKADENVIALMKEPQKSYKRELISALHRDFLRAFRLFLFSSEEITPAQICKSMTAVKVAASTALLSGAILTVASAICSLLYTVPQYSVTLPVALSIALLGFLYGCIIAILLVPVMGKLQIRKMPNAEE